MFVAIVAFLVLAAFLTYGATLARYVWSGQAEIDKRLRNVTR